MRDEERDLTIVPEPAYSVDVQETAKKIGREYGLDLEFDTYQQEMLVVRTRRKVGDNTWSSVSFDIPANILCTQGELEEMLTERFEDMLD